MMPASAHADLADLLDYLGSELAQPQGDLRPALLHTIAELARLLRDDLYDADEERAAPGGTPHTPTLDAPHDQDPALPSAHVLAIRENGALLKVRTRHGIRHLTRGTHGWQPL